MMIYLNISNYDLGGTQSAQMKAVSAYQ